MLVSSSLDEARKRLQELLRTIVNRPEVAGDLADELTQTFHVLRDYVYFTEYQRKELAELCRELEQL